MVSTHPNIPQRDGKMLYTVLDIAKEKDKK